MAKSTVVNRNASQISTRMNNFDSDCLTVDMTSNNLSNAPRSQHHRLVLLFVRPIYLYFFLPMRTDRMGASQMISMDGHEMSQMCSMDGQMTSMNGRDSNTIYLPIWTVCFE